MEQTVTLTMTKDEAAQLNAVMEQCLKVLKESNERGEQTHAEIDSLQRETRAILDQLKGMFNVEFTPVSTSRPPHFPSPFACHI